MNRRRKGWLRWTLGLLFRSGVQFYRDQGFYHAAAISYYFILALIPLLFLLLTLLGYLLGTSPVLVQIVGDFLHVLFPQSEQWVVEEIHRLIAYKQWGWLTLVFYLWITVQMFISVEYALNRIFHVKEKRPLFLKGVVFLLLIAVTVAVIFFSIGVTIVAQHLQETRQETPLLSWAGPLLERLIQTALPLLLVFTLFTWVYRFGPHYGVRLRAAMTGAAVVTVGWSLAKSFFAWYAPRAMALGGLYGSLAAFLMLLLWVYYTCVILLLGAELVAQLQGAAQWEGKRQKRPRNP
jgi:membrane protein